MSGVIGAKPRNAKRRAKVSSEQPKLGTHQRHLREFVRRLAEAAGVAWRVLEPDTVLVSDGPIVFAFLRTPKGSIAGELVYPERDLDGDHISWPGRRPPSVTFTAPNAMRSAAAAARLREALELARAEWQYVQAALQNRTRELQRVQRNAAHLDGVELVPLSSERRCPTFRLHYRSKLEGGSTLATVDVAGVQLDAYLPPKQAARVLRLIARLNAEKPA